MTRDHNRQRHASAVFGVQRIGMTEVKSYSKHWPCLLPQHGRGMKHTRKIELRRAEVLTTLLVEYLLHGADPAGVPHREVHQVEHADGEPDADGEACLADRVGQR